MRLPTLLLHRKANSCKSDFGHIFILAGSARYSGAAVLCSEAAIRSGAGLVTLGFPKGLNNAIIKIKPKEVMTLPLPETKEGTLSSLSYKTIKDFAKKVDVLIVGPGLGRNKSTQQLARKLILNIKRPMVIDADGLNALVGKLHILLCTKYDIRCAKILTPHPGEMSRLTGVSTKKVQKNRKKIAEALARKYKVTVVLKGNQTLVCDYKSNTYINKTGNPGMATAGTGDVLSGMLGAFLGQGLDSFSASKYAVYLHGLAGDLAAGKQSQVGMIASDIVNFIPEAIKKSS